MRPDRRHAHRHRHHPPGGRPSEHRPTLRPRCQPDQPQPAPLHALRRRPRRIHRHLAHRHGQGLFGGTNDTTGLTHLGARVYEPATGRFISVDPLLDPADPQQLNGYSYANNNPAEAAPAETTHRQA
ncbi:RHS repeat-associated core domain-containing protein [Actinomadura sp. NPDC023710]|uniref:RHS repeat-associated core domain-containing protein n=1 Tax=Actinomadura sp. NPDC023710 TaxID=3158219 RepID=UPI0033FACBF4